MSKKIFKSLLNRFMNPVLFGGMLFLVGYVDIELEVQPLFLYFMIFGFYVNTLVFHENKKLRSSIKDLTEAIKDSKDQKK